MQTEHLRKCHRYAICYLRLEIEELKKSIQAESTMSHIKPILKKRLKMLEQDLADIQQYQLD